MTYDIDIEDHVNNIVYVRWLEDLRMTWLDRYFPMKLMLDKGFAPALLETNIRYLRAIHLFEKVTGLVWVGKVGPVRSRLEFEFVVDGQTAAEAYQNLVWIAVKTGKPTRTPKKLLRLWKTEQEQQIRDVRGPADDVT